MEVNFIIVALYSYLLGSIPFGLVLTKIFLKKDIRKTGSGNIGATNVLRTGKKYLAALTLFFDSLKGYVSVFITTETFQDLYLYSAFFCLVGHIYSIWLKFKGGKGVATFLGIIFFLSYDYFIIFILSWLFLIVIFKYSSLSSICSVLSVSIYDYFFIEKNLVLFFIISFILIIYTHKNNLRQLINKKEPKIFK
tara:strand:+ start:2723 stop:3304 length:582 start_codon:yes stop_codon:yes gene_type:complete